VASTSQNASRARGRDQEEAAVVLLEADAHAREAQCHSPALDGEQALVERADDVGQV
jgi:hypothetical protein